MMKKHLVEGVVPVLIELKRSLEGLRHWLLGDLLTCISALLKDHKNEVSASSLHCMAVDWQAALTNVSPSAGRMGHKCASISQKLSNACHHDAQRRSHPWAIIRADLASHRPGWCHGGSSQQAGNH